MVLVTGSTGFLGRRLLSCLVYSGQEAVGVQRSVSGRTASNDGDIAIREINAIDGRTDWRKPLLGVDVVIHCAAVAHGRRGNTQAVNVEGSLNLARQAALEGVRRFIFLSSIGVNGVINTRPFTEIDAPTPAGLYAQTKWEAEQRLWEIQQETGMEVVTIRPPLVYGPGAPGNFGSLVRWVERGVPLPLGAIHNKRSLVALDNLVDLIITCIDHPAAANQVFLAGDGQDLSTTELLRRVGEAMGKPARLIPVPAGLLMAGATILGKRAMAQRLLGSLQVDISKARDVLGWQPPLSVEEGLKRCFPDN